MKAAEFRDMSLDQLDDQLVKLKKEQFNLRFQAASGQLENTSRVRQVRRDIARVLTIARQKRAGAKSANKGWDAALAAIEMVNLFRRLD